MPPLSFHFMSDGAILMRIDVSHARTVVQNIMQAGGMTPEQAQAVARRMVASDLYGHVTHGVAMVPMYLERLGDGRICADGTLKTLQDHGSAFSWECGRLPGAWVMEQAIEQMLERIESHPVVTATIANCGHIGALQVYSDEIAQRGLLGLMMVTDPGVVSVAPFGGATPVLTSNPMAVIIPTRDQPVLVDVSTSVTSNTAVRNYQEAGRKLPGNWLLDNQGVPTNEPSVLADDPPGTILPLGGEDFGYKGFGLGLMVEAYALALTGYGRHQGHKRGGQGVFFQVIDPARFCGSEVFLDETTFVRKQCLDSTPAKHASHAAPSACCPPKEGASCLGSGPSAKNGPGVRMPGQRAQEKRADQLANGLAVDDAVVASIDACAARLKVPGLS